MRCTSSSCRLRTEHRTGHRTGHRTRRAGHLSIELDIEPLSSLLIRNYQYLANIIYNIGPFIHDLYIYTGLRAITQRRARSDTNDARHSSTRRMTNGNSALGHNFLSGPTKWNCKSEDRFLRFSRKALDEYVNIVLPYSGAGQKVSTKRQYKWDDQWDRSVGCAAGHSSRPTRKSKWKKLYKKW